MDEPSKGQRALWTLLFYTLVGLFFGASLALVLFLSPIPFLGFLAAKTREQPFSLWKYLRSFSS